MRDQPTVWMPWYIGDYLRDTQHLKTIEHGAYRLLLDACWCGGNSLPASDEELASIAKMPLQEWIKISQKIMSFFRKKESPTAHWTHKRVGVELRNARKLQKSRSLGAQKTNAKRWSKSSLSDTPGDSLGGRPHNTTPINNIYKGKRLHGIPASEQEVIDFGRTLNPRVDEQTCRDFFSFYEGQGRVNPNGDWFWITSGEAVVTNWKAKLPSFRKETRVAIVGKPAVKPDHSKGF